MAEATHLYDDGHSESGERHADLQSVAHDPLGEAGAPALSQRVQHCSHTSLVQVRLKLTWERGGGGGGGGGWLGEERGFKYYLCSLSLCIHMYKKAR